MSELKAVGKVRTSFGVHGELKFLSYSGDYDHFERMTQVILKKGQVEKQVVLESIRWSGDQPLMKIRGIDQPETAKAFADFEIWVSREQAAPLQEDEYYLSDLVGFKLVYDGHEMATVTGFLEGGTTELLEVRKSNGKTAVIPFMNRYLGDIDLAGKQIELKVEWILE